MLIKLVSLNTEGKKHLEERIFSFLKEQNPDVILLQEVFHEDVEDIKKAVGMTGIFAPMAYVQKNNTKKTENGLWGLLALSRLPVIASGYETYFKYQGKDDLPIFSSTKNPEQMNRALAWIKVLDNQEEIVFATTHFTWSKKGQTTALQQESYQGLEKVLDNLPVAILTGDFNAPRGGEIFTKLSKRYKDNIPQDVVTTIDNIIHKSPEDICLVVDGLFSTTGYLVSKVKVIPGVSDHMAVVGTVKKVD